MTSKFKNTAEKGLRIGATPSKWGQADVLEIYPQISAFIIGQVGWSAGEDLVQEAIYGIAKGVSRASARTPSQFRAWCYQIARNKINDALRSKYGSRIVPLEPEELVDLIEAGVDDPRTLAGLREDLALVLNVLRNSKYPCDEILKARYIFGLEDAEIAGLYEISKDAARMKVNRCLDAAQVIAKKLT